jgi:hypothetical protein
MALAIRRASAAARRNQSVDHPVFVLRENPERVSDSKFPVTPISAGLGTRVLPIGYGRRNVIRSISRASVAGVRSIGGGGRAVIDARSNQTCRSSATPLDVLRRPVLCDDETEARQFCKDAAKSLATIMVAGLECVDRPDHRR